MFLFICWITFVNACSMQYCSVRAWRTEVLQVKIDMHVNECSSIGVMMKQFSGQMSYHGLSHCRVCIVGLARRLLVKYWMLCFLNNLFYFEFVYVFVWEYVHISASVQGGYRHGSHGTCELPNVGLGNQIQAFWKSSIHATAKPPHQYWWPKFDPMNQCENKRKEKKRCGTCIILMLGTPRQEDHRGWF